MFLDEPTSGLDVMSARNLRQVISELSENGVTVFLTTHYVEEAGELCDRIALIVKGKIIEVESPEVLRGRIQDVPLLKIRLKDGSRLNSIDLKEVPAEAAITAAVTVTGTSSFLNPMVTVSSFEVRGFFFDIPI